VFLGVTHSSRTDTRIRPLEPYRQCLSTFFYELTAVQLSFNEERPAVHQESELIEEMRFLMPYVCTSRSLAVAVIVCYAPQFQLKSQFSEFARVHLNESLEFARVELNESHRTSPHALAVSRYL